MFGQKQLQTTNHTHTEHVNSCPVTHRDVKHVPCLCLRGTGRFSPLLSVPADVTPPLRRLTLGTGDKLRNPLWLLRLRGKEQHRQIKASLANFWTRPATFFSAISLFSLYLWHTHCAAYLLGFIQIWPDVQKLILHRGTQTSDILYELSVDNRRQLYSHPYGATR